MTVAFFVQADKIISNSSLDKEYSAIHGDAEFCKLVAQLAFGDDSSIVKDGLVSGTLMCHCLAWPSVLPGWTQ